MAMTCESCRIVFFGRPNKKFCSIDCRRAAEMKKRQIKKDKKIEAYKAYMENLPPEWHALPVDPWPEYEPLEWPADDPWPELFDLSVCLRETKDSEKAPPGDRRRAESPRCSRERGQKHGEREQSGRAIVTKKATQKK